MDNMDMVIDFTEWRQVHLIHSTSHKIIIMSRIILLFIKNVFLDTSVISKEPC